MRRRFMPSCTPANPARSTKWIKIRKAKLRLRWSHSKLRFFDMECDSPLTLIITLAARRLLLFPSYIRAYSASGQLRNVIKETNGINIVYKAYWTPNRALDRTALAWAILDDAALYRFHFNQIRVADYCRRSPIPKELGGFV